jgi:threonyl-tRNA synthetase
MEIVAAKKNGELIDLCLAGEVYEPVYENDSQALDILRHSCAHVMAEAVKELFPEVKVAIGPSTESGFYYDFDRDEPFTDEHLAQIEKRMQEIIDAKLPFKRKVIPIKEALDYFQGIGEIYKVEIIEELKKQGESEVSLYSQGNFVDLCRGPHIPHTGFIKAFKLLSVAGAYWRGDERNKMLQRIYGTAFFKKEELDKYLKHLEEARERDHRKLGKELELFSISDEIGPGLVVYHPNGAMLRYLLEDFERKEHLRRGYQMVIGPQIMRLELWKRSGHYDNYRENMYFTEIDEQQYAVKPMNCPGCTIVYRTELHSYRDLPRRYFEFGHVHRHEMSGALAGLFRVRSFTQDDAHIFCTPEHVENEILNLIHLIFDIYKTFGFQDVSVGLSTRPEKYIGDLSVWDKAEKALKKALETAQVNYHINEGDGAFYGPKIDFTVRDSLKRKWQLGTIQLDFSMPYRFGLEYVGTDGNHLQPVMIHRAILGSFERFIGVLLEHTAGNLPLWLSPVQIMILPISDKFKEYAEKVKTELENQDFRVSIDHRSEKIQRKIRDAEVQKVPFMAIIGEQEVSQNQIALRQHKVGDKGKLNVSDFISFLKKEIQQSYQYQLD